jgi:hypothetical protein
MENQGLAIASADRFPFQKREKNKQQQQERNAYDVVK